ncbi:MAG: hypothetical protein LQ340_006082 [Diploschistes diacapsis]|nr:MAG: hypothetical protein LQ340_006082 [Diploschistes diacapsis]
MHTHQQPKLEIPRSSSIYPDDVSPPDSPRPGDGARSSSPNVSPITDAGSGHRLSNSSRPYVSNIPLPLKQKSGGTAAFISGWREKIAAAQASGKMKWDDYSGEPTGSEKGKTQSAIPGSTHFDKPGYGNSTTITSQPPGTKSMFGTTLKKVPRKEASSPSPPPKEEWKGASGRAPIIPPVQTKPDPTGTKKSFPTPSQRRQKQGIKQAMGLKQSEGKLSPAQETEKSSPQQPSKNNLPQNYSPQRLGEVAEEFDSSAYEGSDVETPRQEYTQSPLSMPPRTDSIGVLDHNTAKGDPLPSLSIIPAVEETPPVARKVSTEPIAKKPLPPEKSPRTTSLPPMQAFSEEQLHLAVHNLNLYNEPASRFSATTFNTTIQDIPDTPKQSFDEPALPSPVAESILNRRRPIAPAGGFARSKPPSRKPTPSQLSEADRDSKALPQQPAEETAVDRVVLLEAKLNSLKKRKQNLQTVIHELTNVVQPSSTTYDQASRQEIKKTVEGLNLESAAVAKEIHETGLKLHRAMKKRDDSELYEPTGLWVRRVTG